jgi:hypothetical protein
MYLDESPDPGGTDDMLTPTERSVLQWRFGLGSDDLIDDVAHKGAPAVNFGQLRRICPNMVKTLADIGDHGLDLIPRRMGQGEQ